MEVCKKCDRKMSNLDFAHGRKKVRRCQGWDWATVPNDTGAKYVRWKTAIVQCEQPAENGVHCAVHTDQVPVEWMDKPDD